MFAIYIYCKVNVLLFVCKQGKMTAGGRKCLRNGDYYDKKYDRLWKKRD